MILSGNRYENGSNVSIIQMCNDIPVFWYTTKRLAKSSAAAKAGDCLEITHQIQTRI